MTYPARFRGGPEGAFNFRVKRFLPRATLWLLVAFVPPTGSAVEPPAAMLIDGTIGSRWSLPPVVAASGDRVLAFSTTDGQLVGQGLVAGDGEFVVEAVQTAALNNTLVRLEMQKGRVRYQLLQDGQQAAFVFRGGILPRRLTLGLRIGAVTALLPDTPATTGPMRASATDVVRCDPATMDVNRDGVCDAADLAILSLYGAGVTRSAPTPAAAPTTLPPR